MKKWLLIGILFLFFISTYDLVIGVAPQKQIEIGFNEEQLKKGHLILVNRMNILQSEATDLIMLPNTNIQINAALQQPLNTLLKDAENAGFNSLQLNSGYRTAEDQQILYEEMGEQYALPAGYSEHQTGLAIDIGSSKGLLENTEEGKWLEENAWKYGFILRYPKNKIEFTGIQYEPWHFRYVGLPHSKKMYQEDWVLEEYLAFLKKKKRYSMRVNGEKYTVKLIQAPFKNKYSYEEGEIIKQSGDNQGNLIMTIN